MARGKDNARRYFERRNVLFSSGRSRVKTRQLDEKMRVTMRNAITIAMGIKLADAIGVDKAMALLSLERGGFIDRGLLSPQAIEWATEMIKRDL